MTTITETIQTANNKTYEISLFTDWYNAEIKCIDTGRVYPCDFSGETDDGYSDEQNIEWALEDAREWCEWHSNQSIEHEHTEDGRIYRQ